MWMGWTVIRAARSALEGASLSQCVLAAKESLAHSGGYVMIDTLEYIQRSGRISNTQRMFGTILDMKPILSVVDGDLVGIERVRTRRKAFRRLVALAKRQVKDSKSVYLAVMHANVEVYAKELLEMVSETLHPVETMITSIGPN